LAANGKLLSVLICIVLVAATVQLPWFSV